MGRITRGVDKGNYLYLYAFVFHFVWTFHDNDLSGHVLDIGREWGMRTETLRIMAGLERRLNTYEIKVQGHCGHEELMDDAIRYRERMMDWFSDQIEKLCQKAGVQ